MLQLLSPFDKITSSSGGVGHYLKKEIAENKNDLRYNSLEVQ